MGSQIVTLKLSKYKNKRVLHFNENLKIPLKLNYRDKKNWEKTELLQWLALENYFLQKFAYCRYWDMYYNGCFNK